MNEETLHINLQGFFILFILFSELTFLQVDGQVAQLCDNATNYYILNPLSLICYNAGRYTLNYDPCSNTLLPVVGDYIGKLIEPDDDPE